MTTRALPIHQSMLANFTFTISSDICKSLNRSSTLFYVYVHVDANIEHLRSQSLVSLFHCVERPPASCCRCDACKFPSCRAVSSTGLIQCRIPMALAKSQTWSVQSSSNWAAIRAHSASPASLESWHGPKANNEHHMHVQGC